MGVFDDIIKAFGVGSSATAPAFSPVPLFQSVAAAKPNTNFLSGTATPGPYRTALPPLEEFGFRQWVQRNRIPFDDSPTSDYDMRGYWKAQQQGDTSAATKVSLFDNQPHYPDTWKTPYHQSFSRESIYATKNAPTWTGDQLKDKLGTVLVDETPGKAK